MVAAAGTHAPWRCRQRERECQISRRATVVPFCLVRTWRLSSALHACRHNVLLLSTAGTCIHSCLSLCLAFRPHAGMSASASLRGWLVASPSVSWDGAVVQADFSHAQTIHQSVFGYTKWFRLIWEAWVGHTLCLYEDILHWMVSCIDFVWAEEPNTSKMHRFDLDGPLHGLVQTTNHPLSLSRALHHFWTAEDAWVAL